mgnify:CR=1 FL=1
MAEDRLYFRQLLAGRDFAQSDPIARQMVNFVYLVGDRETGEAVHNLMRDQEEMLLQPLLDFAASRNSVRLLGPTEAALRAPTVALECETSGEELATKLAKYGIMAGGGDFYAVRALEALGVDMEKAVLRLSFVHYTTRSEIDKLLNALEDVL